MIRNNCSWSRYTKVIGGLSVASTVVATDAFIPSAHAGIIYTDVSPDLTMSTIGESINFDLDRSGAAPFAALNSNVAGEDFHLRSTGSPDVTTFLSLRPETSVSGYYIEKLGAGATIDASRPWQGGVAYFEFFGAGQWEGGADAYIGLRLQNGADFNYGWAHLFYDDVNNTMTLKGFAIEMTANMAIAAGDIGAVAAVPEPSSFLLLALGAGGLAVRNAKRRREEQAA